MKIDFDAIPKYLKEKHSWVMWRLEDRNGKKSKIPYHPIGKKAMSNNPDSWVSFELAQRAHEAGGFSGVGIVLVDDLVGIDLDHCGPGTEQHPQACGIIDKIGSYTEWSPSGNGLRIFCRGEARHRGKGIASEGKSWVEVYDKESPRFLTVTGNQHHLSAALIFQSQPGLDWIHDEYTKRPEVIHQPAPIRVVSFSDQELLDKIGKSKTAGAFASLYAGDISGYGNDHSAADMALCNTLAFWCGRDAGQMDRLFRSSGLYRPEKWDRNAGAGVTYGQRTILKALDRCTKIYEPPPPRKHPPKQAKAAQKQLPPKMESDPPPVEEQPVEEDLEWRHDLQWRRDKEGNRTGLFRSISNLAKILTRDAEMKKILVFDEFLGDILSLNEPPWNRGEYAVDLGKTKIGSPWLDEDYTRLQAWLESAWLLPMKDTQIYAATLMVAKKHRYNPIQKWLGKLEWDGQKRLGDWLVKYCQAEASDHNKTVGEKWLIGAVARAMQPGCKMDNVLILEGEQGIGKSTAIQILAKKWFSDTPIHISTKDAYMALQGVWLVELAELDSLMRAEDRESKAFFSSASDKYRPPYARRVQTFPRSCVFCGSVNLQDYLRDETGARRYWPVKIGEVDTAGLQGDVDQLWAEAFSSYKDGVQWWAETREEKVLLKSEAKKRQIEDPWMPIIVEYLESTQLHRKEEGIPPVEILMEACRLQAKDIATREEMRLSRIMAQLDGWSKVRVMIKGHRTRCYRWDGSADA